MFALKEDYVVILTESFMIHERFISFIWFKNTNQH